MRVLCFGPLSSGCRFVFLNNYPRLRDFLFLVVFDFLDFLCFLDFLPPDDEEWIRFDTLSLILSKYDNFLYTS